MPGRNVLHEDSNYRRAMRSAGQSCVFISHSHYDVAFARKVDEQIRSANINTYFAPTDAATQVAAKGGDSSALAIRIETALSECTHLLGLITPTARATSWWVPYEIGGARGRGREVAHLVHEQVKDVPEFLSLGAVIWDVYDLRKWLENLRAATLSEVIRVDSIKEAALSGLVPPFRSASFTANT